MHVVIRDLKKLKKKVGPVCHICGNFIPCKHFKFTSKDQKVNPVNDSDIKELYEIEQRTIDKLKKLQNLL